MSPAVLSLVLALIPLIPAAIDGITEAVKAVKFGFGVVQSSVKEGRDPTQAEWNKMNQLIAANQASLHDTSGDV